MDFSVVARAGLTQREFAVICGVSRVTANTWVRGKMQPHRYINGKVSAMLGHIDSATNAGDFPLPRTVPRDIRMQAIRDVIRSYIVAKN